MQPKKKDRLRKQNECECLQKGKPNDKGVAEKCKM